jgi:hypothetical protein
MGIQLGDRARDRITGFTGIVIGKTEWLNKCSRFGLQAEKLDGGKVVDAQWFDSEQVELVKAGVIVINKLKTGGPRDYETVRRADPVH